MLSLLPVTIINIFIVTTAVIIHFEMLSRLSKMMPRLTIRYRFRVVIGICGALLAHTIEIWLFTFAYYLMIMSGKFGTLWGVEELDLANCAYFSFITYTTLGYGDIVPQGQLRFLAGLESLTGLVLITWTASFSFYQMQKYWSEDDQV